ncbi:UNVERIFIED_CONTAM: hypothetical protein GTU68_013531, partial [Idotea baltica]|nr:hypothetical protein [Idotea baltica]
QLQFDWNVQDDSDELDFGHSEKKSDGKVEGIYYVLLPDTRRQQKVRTTWTVDSGFVADVTYSAAKLNSTVMSLARIPEIRIKSFTSTLYCQKPFLQMFLRQSTSLRLVLGHRDSFFKCFFHSTYLRLGTMSETHPQMFLAENYCLRLSTSQ